MTIFRDFNPIDHDRAVEDRRRHKQLIEGAIKKNLVDILSEESIIGQNKDRKIRIPIRGMKEYQFIYGENSAGVGSGTGKEKRGDRIASGKGQGNGKGNKGAGNDDGEDIYETEVSIEEIINYLFEELDLPHLDKKKSAEIVSDKAKKKSGYQKNGIRPRLAKKRTVMEKLKRKQGYKRALREKGKEEEIERFPFKEDDLRYHRIKNTIRREYNAVVICIMDTSSSMDRTKKYLARSFFFLLYQFVKMRYERVEVQFIAHSTKAKIVSEHDFFYKMESGGTYISSGYEKALEVIENEYNPELWNIYTFHVSDGDNWSEDNDKAIEKAKELCQICNLFGYTEIMPGMTFATMKKKYLEQIKYENFSTCTIKNKEELWNALKSILIPDVKEG